MREIPKTWGERAALLGEGADEHIAGDNPWALSRYAELLDHIQWFIDREGIDGPTPYWADGGKNA